MELFQKLLKNTFNFEILFLLGFFIQVYSKRDGYETVEIAGIFSKTTSAPAEAAKLAIEDINSMRKENSLRVILNIGETSCNEQTAASQMYKLLSKGNPKLAIIAGCPEDCETVAKAAPTWNTLSICYGISTPTRNGNPFNLESVHLPNLFLAQPHLSSITPSLISFIKYFEWKRVGILYDDDYPKFSEMALALSSTLKNHEVESFQLELGLSPMSPSLELIKSLNLRIILTLVDEDSYRTLLCEIYRMGLFGSEKYVWIFLGTSGKEWFLKSNLLHPSSRSEKNKSLGLGRSFGLIDLPPPLVENEEELDVDMLLDTDIETRESDCKPEELVEAADGHFTTQAVSWDLNENLRTIGGTTVKDFKRRLLTALRESGEHLQSDFDEAPLAYDSVWAAYLSLNKTLVECQVKDLNCDLTYENYELGFNIQDNLKSFWFEGVSGNFSFFGNRRSVSAAGIKIQRFKNNKITTVAIHYNSNNSFSWLDPNHESIPDDGGKDFDAFPTDLFPPSELPSLNPDQIPICNNSGSIYLPMNLWKVYLFMIASVIFLKKHYELFDEQ